MVQGSSESRADVRLYFVVHSTFRLATTRLVDAAEKLEPSALQRTIGSHWSFYSGALHHHHESEDNSTFPVLGAARPDLGVLIKRLEDDHQQLIVAMEAVDSAVANFERQPGAADQATLHDALVAVRDLFFPHLDTEDAEILPAIAESLPAKEWERMDTATLKSLPRQYLARAVAAMDEVVQGLPKEERPPPPPVPIRLMLALSWRKKYAAWMKPALV